MPAGALDKRRSDNGNRMMSILRINEFKANPDSAKALFDFLFNLVPIIKANKGCIDVKTAAAQDDPTIFLVVETWETIEDHQNSVKSISTEEIKKIMPLLAQTPRGRYFYLNSPTFN